MTYLIKVVLLVIDYEILIKLNKLFELFVNLKILF